MKIIKFFILFLFSLLLSVASAAPVTVKLNVTLNTGQITKSVNGGKTEITPWVGAVNGVVSLFYDSAKTGRSEGPSTPGGTYGGLGNLGIKFSSTFDEAFTRKIFSDNNYEYQGHLSVTTVTGDFIQGSIEIYNALVNSDGSSGIEIALIGFSGPLPYPGYTLANLEWFFSTLSERHNEFEIHVADWQYDPSGQNRKWEGEGVTSIASVVVTPIPGAIWLMASTLLIFLSVKRPLLIRPLDV